MFIVLLSFTSSLATKCVSLNDETFMIRPTLIDLNPVQLNYYPFLISLDKCSGSCNVLSPKMCVSKKEIKDMNVKSFNMITTKNEAKTMEKHISCNCKCKFNSTTCISNQKWYKKTCQCKCKNYHKSKKDCNWNPSTCICENSKYLKSIANTSGIECNKIITVMEFFINKRDYYILHISFNISHITIDYYY